MVKVATLRQPHLFHPDFYQEHVPAGTTIEVVPLENSTDIKNAVLTGAADFGVTGITASIQSAAAGEPLVVIASAADGGSGIVARDGIETIADLAGTKVGYVAGSAQDILLRLSLREVGLDADQDVELVRIGFADMPAALERGDIDAFSGAEVGPSIALVNGANLVSRPYDTPMGKINIVMVTSRDLIESDPELVQTMVQVHADATEAMAADPAVWAERVIAKYGFEPAHLDLAIPNIELRWEIDEAYIAQAEVQGAQMALLNQIPAEPDYGSLFDPTFVDAVTGP